MPPATNSAGALAQLQQFQGSAKTADQATSDANQQFGVDAAQQQVTGLRGAIQRTTSLLNNVAPSVYGRTGNSLVTNAQATRQIGNESAPIQADLQKNSSDYANAEQDYQTAEQKAEAKAAGTLSDQQSRLSYLQGIYGNLYQQEQDAAKATEAKREFDAQMAESTAARKASAAASAGASPSFGGGSSSSSGGPAVSAQTFSTDLKNAFNGIMTRPKQYTEQVILKNLKAAYGNVYSPDAINNMVYNYRKQNYGF